MFFQISKDHYICVVIFSNGLNVLCQRTFRTVIKSSKYSLCNFWSSQRNAIKHYFVKYEQFHGICFILAKRFFLRVSWYNKSKLRNLPPAIRYWAVIGIVYLKEVLHIELTNIQNHGIRQNGYKYCTEKNSSEIFACKTTDQRKVIQISTETIITRCPSLGYLRRIERLPLNQKATLIAHVTDILKLHVIIKPHENISPTKLLIELVVQYF